MFQHQIIIKSLQISTALFFAKGLRKYLREEVASCGGALSHLSFFLLPIFKAVVYSRPGVASDEL